MLDFLKHPDRRWMHVGPLTRFEASGSSASVLKSPADCASLLVVAAADHGGRLRQKNQPGLGASLYQ